MHKCGLFLLPLADERDGAAAGAGMRAAARRGADLEPTRSREVSLVKGKLSPMVSSPVVTCKSSAEAVNRRATARRCTAARRSIHRSRRRGGHGRALEKREDEGNPAVAE